MKSHGEEKNGKYKLKRKQFNRKSVILYSKFSLSFRPLFLYLHNVSGARIRETFVRTSYTELYYYILRANIIWRHNNSYHKSHLVERTFFVMFPAIVFLVVCWTIHLSVQPRLFYEFHYSKWFTFSFSRIINHPRCSVFHLPFCL